jgi:hypothetical protein
MTVEGLPMATGRRDATLGFMKLLAIAALSATISLSASADEKPLIDKADNKLSAGQKATKSGARNLESDTNNGLAKARKSGRNAGLKLEKGANDAARSLRQKLGTEKKQSSD